MAGFVFVVLAAIAIWLVVKANKARSWHNEGIGERKARAEYARLQRENPDSPEAKATEAEFVESYVSAQPTMARYFIAALMIGLVVMPVSSVVL
ncbi:MAG: hypothetical protein FH752_14080 [Marinobacter adhaerens]|uniref:Uncharacterized protein n=1 Tax=Marinobacter adhaerens TaxID=1033846 RepID=A0A844I403_9GAMM|nr:hypothetical protein [Marinobacter adhaerens]